jgi:hypothetical protein
LFPFIRGSTHTLIAYPLQCAGGVRSSPGASLPPPALAAAYRRSADGRAAGRGGWPCSLPLSPAGRYSAANSPSAVMIPSAIRTVGASCVEAVCWGNNFVVFCFAGPEDAEAFAKRFGGERWRRAAGGDPENKGRLSALFRTNARRRTSAHVGAREPGAGLRSPTGRCRSGPCWLLPRSCIKWPSRQLTATLWAVIHNRSYCPRHLTRTANPAKEFCPPLQRHHVHRA